MANAVKAFIVKEGKLLLIKRSDEDVQSPGGWEFPGGRLDDEEDPYKGLKREVKEETGLEISVEQVMDVQHFTRVDGQVITMMIFICIADGEIELSDEHEEARWVWLDDAKESLLDCFHVDIDIYKKYFR